MLFGSKRFVSLVLALCVMLSLAFAPLFSQQAMASHHAADHSVEIANQVDHGGASKKSCGKKSGDSGNMSLDCCDMSCSPMVVFVAHPEVPQTNFVAKYVLVDADQLTSRITFGLKRPPRA